MRSCGKDLLRACRQALAVVAAAVLLVTALAPVVRAQDSSHAAELYKEALAREALLRRELDADRPKADSAELLDRVRVLIGAYEDLSRLFPASGYSDNALWQGALLSADAFWQFGGAGDRSTALKMLQALRSRFPTSSLVKQVPAQLNRLDAAKPVDATPPAAAVPRSIVATPPLT